MRTQCRPTPAGNAPTIFSHTCSASASPVATHFPPLNGAMSSLIWRPSKRPTTSCCSSDLSTGRLITPPRAGSNTPFTVTAQRYRWLWSLVAPANCGVLGNRCVAVNSTILVRYAVGIPLEYLDGGGLEREHDRAARSEREIACGLSGHGGD